VLPFACNSAKLLKFCLQAEGHTGKNSSLISNIIQKILSNKLLNENILR